MRMGVDSLLQGTVGNFHKHGRKVCQNISFQPTTATYLSLVLDLPPVVQGLVCRLAVPPEDAAQVAVGDGEAHHGNDVGHQEEDDLRTGCNDVSVKVCVTW